MLPMASQPLSLLSGLELLSDGNQAIDDATLATPFNDNGCWQQKKLKALQS
jgi:hypothetical protein